MVSMPGKPAGFAVAAMLGWCILSGCAAAPRADAGPMGPVELRVAEEGWDVDAPTVERMLQSVVREPAKYRCAIGYVGVYSLPMMFTDGDIPQTESGQSFLARVMPETAAEQQAQSPAFNVDKIRVPVMLVQGGKDERVPITQYNLLKRRLEEAGRPAEVTMVKPKEGHGFYDVGNRVKLYTEMLAFFNRHIGPGAGQRTASAD